MACVSGRMRFGSKREQTSVRPSTVWRYSKAFPVIMYRAAGFSPRGLTGPNPCPSFKIAVHKNGICSGTPVGNTWQVTSPTLSFPIETLDPGLMIQQRKCGPRGRA